MDFLFEIGLDEVPARMLPSAEAELTQRLSALLKRERLLDAASLTTSMSTPRRLAVMVTGVSERQQEITEDLMGPSAKIAFKDGQATPAGIAFAKKAGIDPSALKVVSTAKGEYVLATIVKRGVSAAEIIASELPKELSGIYWAKNMYWRAGAPERFVRPVRWMVALLGEQVVPVSFAGCVADRSSRGHRVLHGSAPISVESPAAYKAQLLEAHVMVDVEERRHVIRKALDHVCRSVPGTRWREDPALVDKMTHMTEWPSVILGTFDASYLTLPEEVLVTVMRSHQNYFAIEDSTGKLAPHFLAVLNTVAGPEGEAKIRAGNERVLRARFNDARFFWDFDQRISLEDRVALLENVTFQRDLGTYAAKSLRVAAIAETLSTMVIERGRSLNKEALKDAVRLAKTDLTTELVKEFTELQGEIGGLYARAQGLSEATADAIYDQYRPLSMEDRIPGTLEGQILAISDKVDSIVGMFGLGLEPSGSKDPFALRRAANGIVKILAEGGLALLVEEIISAASPTKDVASKVAKFLQERLHFYLKDVRQFPYDVVAAVLAVGSDDIPDVIARAQAVSEARGSEDFAAVSAAFKRMRNLLSQASEKGISPAAQIQKDLFQHVAEGEFEQASGKVGEDVRAMRNAGNYKGSLAATALLRPQVDAFFDSVMVMDKDEAVRANRLALIARVSADFNGVADLTEIVIQG